MFYLGFIQKIVKKWQKIVKNTGSLFQKTIPDLGLLNSRVASRASGTLWDDRGWLLPYQRDPIPLTWSIFNYCFIIFSLFFDHFLYKILKKSRYNIHLKNTKL